MESSITFTVKSNWWTGRKILKLVKKQVLSAYRSGLNEIVLTVRADDKEKIYKLLLQNKVKEIKMSSGMFNL
ncbi:MAG: hypothetical protein WBF33_29145 [Candidatus Nitrosopolaris sp.]